MHIETFAVGKRMVEPSHSCVVAHSVDVFHARAMVRQVATLAGASQREAAELQIVASELAWNILRHVGRGCLEVAVERHADCSIVSIRARDGGPALDLELVAQDGWSQKGIIAPEERLGRPGIGCGLGAVKRLSTRLEQEHDERGKTLIATRTLKRR